MVQQLGFLRSILAVSIVLFLNACEVACVLYVHKEKLSLNSCYSRACLQL